MKMSIENAKRLQWFLNVLTSNAMEVVYLGGGYHPNSWQFAVEAAYRLKYCNLIDFSFDVLTKYEKLSNNTFDGLDDFCYHLSVTDPDDWSYAVWIDAQMHLTPKGRSLIEYYFKDFDTEEINVSFIERLEHIFAEYQVPWDEENPRFPVDVSKLQQSSKKNTSAMSIYSARSIQWFLLVLTSDSMGTVYLTSGYHPNAWQFAVEAAYRLKYCNLIDFSFDVLTKYEKLSNNTFDGLDDFCYHLSVTDPDDWSYAVWIDAQMHLTPKGRSLIEYYFKDFDTEEINVSFIERLEHIFAEYQVPWDEENPRFPVDVSKLQQSSKKNTSSADQD